MIALEQNYRSTQPILDTSNTLISRATERFTKNLWTHREGGEPPWLVTTNDEQQQTRFVVERILELHEEGIPLSEMAVLFRAAYMSADLEIELTNRKIPFEKWGGLKFLEAAHVKDVLAFLRVIENPRDEVSWFRLLQLLPGHRRGHGPIGHRLDGRKCLGARGLRALPAATPRSSGTRAPGRTADAVARSVLQAATKWRLTSPASACCTTTSFASGTIASSRGSRTWTSCRRLPAAIPTAARSSPPSRSNRRRARRTSRPARPEEEDDALVLSTVHSAKGKEWDAVFVIWAVDGWFPMARALGDDDELEEERRLMYVAMTRARDHLAVTYPLNAYSTRRGSDYTIDQLSRFIDPGIRDTMQRVVPKFDDPAPPPVEPVSPLDLRELMKRRFGAS